MIITLLFIYIVVAITYYRLKVFKFYNSEKYQYKYFEDYSFGFVFGSVFWIFTIPAEALFNLLNKKNKNEEN